MEKGEKVPVGIKGFEEMIDGGLERGSVTVLRGGPGTGKTTFALQFLYNGCARFGEPGAFISFEETRDSIFATGKKFGWDFARLEKDGSFAFIGYKPHEVERILGEGGGLIRDTLEAVGATRIVIDSITAYSLLFKTSYEADQGVLELTEMLKSWNCTSLVTAQGDVEAEKIKSERLSFISDGLIHFYYIRKQSAKMRAIEIIKMRRIKHSERVALLKILSNGIAVYPEIGIFG